jgi:hypothetical protein
MGGEDVISGDHGRSYVVRILAAKGLRVTTARAAATIVAVAPTLDAKFQPSL